MKLIAAAVIAFAALDVSGVTRDRSAALDALDEAIERRESYIAQRSAEIDSIKMQYAATGDEALLMSLGESYAAFVNDSALYYFEKAAILSSDPSRREEAKMRRAALLPLAGYYGEAVRTFDAVDTAALGAAMMVQYHDAGRRLYSFLASAYEKNRPYVERCRSAALDHQSRLLALLKTADNALDEYVVNAGEHYFMTGDTARAVSLLTELCEHCSDLRILARAHHHLATAAMVKGRSDEAVGHLAASAIADIESATLEVKSLQDLGATMYDNGDTERAYRYLSTALDNAVRCGATLRMVESSRSLPMIEQSHNAKVAAWRRGIYWIIAVMGTLLAALGVSLGLLYGKIKQLNVTRERLCIANRNKDAYLGQFLQLCSIYMDKLTRFCKLVERKISAGKADELLRMTKSGKFIEEQSADFYKVIDQAFLHIYPDFVERVNDLLQPDQRIELAPGERLNTDLRILAIKRMGIDDAASIALLLNYSLNTIYAYRNRLKARAICRDTFDDDIMKIAPQT